MSIFVEVSVFGPSQTAVGFYVLIVLLEILEGSRRRGEVLGQCCGKPGTGDCGGYSKGKPAIEHYQDNLFGTPAVTTWKRKFQAHYLQDL